MEYTRRLFVGIVVSHDAVKVLRKRERQLDQAYPDLPVRWTPMDNLHLTVSFLGHVDDVRLPEVITALTEVVAEHAPFDLVFDRWMLGPSVEQPKMVWLSAREPISALGALKTDVERTIAPLHPVIGAYRPHITLGRIAQKRWRALEEKPELEKDTAIVVMVESVTLFESATVEGKRAFVPLAVCELGTGTNEEIASLRSQ